MKTLLEYVSEASPEVTTDTEALNWAREKKLSLNEEIIKDFRRVLREALQVEVILNRGPTEFETTFDGYGDSGMVEDSHDDYTINAFLSYMVETRVDFDWYNNEGGGGDITWNISTDVVTINGYENVVERVSQMEEETF